MNKYLDKYKDILLNGGIGVIPTDTIYGLVGRADLRETVQRIYKVRKRNAKKPCIILISSFDDLNKFNIKISDIEKQIIKEKKLWPGKVSIIFPVSDSKFKYLHCGEKSLAFRMPENTDLLDFICKTGPLIAPSANTEGNSVALNIEDAKKYFGNSVDFYIDNGEQNNLPSTIIKFEHGEILIIRKGSVNI